jgi:hypothetical protein
MGLKLSKQTENKFKTKIPSCLLPQANQQQSNIKQLACIYIHVTNREDLYDATEVGSSAKDLGSKTIHACPPVNILITL